VYLSKGVVTVVQVGSRQCTSAHFQTGSNL